MNLGTREEVLGLIGNSGSTLCDLAANFGCTPEELAKELKQLGVPLPSMTFEGPFDFIKGLRRGISNKCTAQEILTDPFGGLQHMPRGEKGEFIPDIGLIYRAVHGDKIIDPYSGKEVSEEALMAVDGNPENYLITNIEAIGRDTWAARFEHSIGLTREVFKFCTRYFEIEIEVGRKYDQLVGGTYSPEYMHQLFCTWVGYPLNLYYKRNPEEETIFAHTTPTFVAWWIWSQLSYYAQLKGLRSIKVTSVMIHSMDQFSSSKAPVRSLAPATMQQSAVLCDVDVLFALESVVVSSQANAISEMQSDTTKEVTASPM